MTLIGLDPAQQPLHPLVAETVRDVLLGGIGPPALRSEAVLVVNDPDGPPRYCNGPVELIMLHSPGNYPWQYAYQLAHELGHLSARADLRFPRSDGLMWLEEVLADCHTLIALKRMASGNGLLKSGATSYLRHLLDTQGSQAPLPGWYRENEDALRSAMSLTAECRDVSRHIFTHVDHERILSDNRQLVGLGAGETVETFLDRWAAMGDDDKGVPTLLKRLL
jgi:hypothetical protein